MLLGIYEESFNIFERSIAVYILIHSQNRIYSWYTQAKPFCRSLACLLLIIDLFFQLYHDHPCKAYVIVAALGHYNNNKEKTQDFCHRYNAVKKQQYQMNDLYN